MSPSSGNKCCEEFDFIMKELYEAEYLRKPTEQDLRGIINLHHHVHNCPGLFGSLDCMHLFWKNCPKAWQGSYKGKEGKPTVVLEAICDYHLWFWHSHFGSAGTLNDISILSMSSLMTMFTSGELEALEERSGVVPFRIGDEEFKNVFCLVDGIYPKFARFVKGMSVPVTAQETRYTKWQEATRKDIERGFGVLQRCFQFTARPIQGHFLKGIGNRLRTCLILHNMIVSDRVMGGNPRQRYKPSHMYHDAARENIQQPPNLQQVQAHHGGVFVPPPVLPVTPEYVEGLWHNLQDANEHMRLFEALLSTH